MSFERSVNSEFRVLSNEVRAQLSYVGIISEARVETETQFETFL